MTLSLEEIIEEIRSNQIKRGVEDGFSTREIQDLIGCSVRKVSDLIVSGHLVFVGRRTITTIDGRVGPYTPLYRVSDRYWRKKGKRRKK